MDSNTVLTSILVSKGFAERSLENIKVAESNLKSSLEELPPEKDMEVEDKLTLISFENAMKCLELSRVSLEEYLKAIQFLERHFDIPF